MSFRYILLTAWITTVWPQTSTTSVSSSALIQIVQQLANQTKALENRLDQETQSQLALLQEIQSKNDLLQFLQGDISALNQTLQKEREEKNSLEKRLIALENKVTSLEATVIESKDSRKGLEARLETLKSTVNQEVPKLIEGIKDLNQTVESLLTSTSQLQDLNVSSIIADHSKISTLEKEIMSLDAKFKMDSTYHTAEVKSLNTALLNITVIVDNLRRKFEATNNSIQSSIAASEASVRVTVDAILNKTVDEEVGKLLQHIQVLNQTLTKQIGDERNSVNIAEANIQSLSSTLQSQQNQLIVTNTRIQNLQLNVSDLKAARNMKVPAVLFSVSRPEEMVVQHPHFTKTIYNVGGAFDPSTSLFIAPVSGHYLFTATIQKTTQGDRITCWIRLNGSLLMSVDAHAAFPGTEASGSNTVLVRMTKGDRLELSECQGNSRFSQDGSTFSGALLTQV